MGSNIFTGINWSNPSWDLFIVVFFIISAFVYGVSLGRDRIIVILVSIYISLSVVNTIPEAIFNIGINKVHAFQITAFVLVFMALFFLLSRSGLMRTFGEAAAQGPFWQVILFSILHVGLLTSIGMSFLPEVALHKFAPITQTIFTQDWMQFFWVAAPVVAMLLIKPEEKRNK